jgi:hypothetical protein
LGLDSTTGRPLIDRDTVAFINATRDLGRSFVLRAHDPKRVRLVFLVAVAAPLAAFIPLAVKAWQKDAFAWDGELSETMRTYGNRQTFLNRYADLLGLILHPAVQVVGALLIVAGLLALVAHGRVRAALFLGLSVAGAVIGAPLLKELFDSSPAGPQHAGYSFPSGHALRTMTAAAALTAVTWRTAWRRTTTALGGISVVLIGVALVYQDWHRASEVIAGWCLGIAWVACVWLAVRPVYTAGGRIPQAAAAARTRDYDRGAGVPATSRMPRGRGLR